VNFGSRSGYRWIGTHRSDACARTKLNNFTCDRIASSSSCSPSFFTDVTGLVICSICKYHPMALIFVFCMLVSRRWVTELSSINKNPSQLVLTRFWETQYKHTYSYTYEHSPLWTHTRTPYPMSISERLSWFDLEIYEVGHQECLTVDGDVVSHWKNN
jgi:hypothetical protein